MSMNSPAPRADRPEIWGGVECSHVRLAYGDNDQLEHTGHDHRFEDLDRLAELGLTAVRYPVLWERHAGSPIDWSWADARLHRLRELGIRPIVGLVHHGCGPLPDGFLDPDFGPGLARFARAVAERYPWVDAYTPINEPLTTARFSGLYGIWHPFLRDAASFAHIFLRQCQAIRAAMRAIRAINPSAQLVQTEDLGKTHSTPSVAYQARFENERRWLTWDLLGGFVRPGTWMHEHLVGDGVDPADLASFVDDPCPPDILGMNHYVTSERLLDDRLDRYPVDYHGGNGRHAYADVPAVRARLEGLVGPEHLLDEIWQRYQRPIAITEVQLACTRDEQLRWLAEFWTASCSARARGVDVRAVTPWALFGACDWDSLLRLPRGHYECGAFDMRQSPPRPTALAHAISDLAQTGTFHHPAAEGPGWWRRPCRFTFDPVSAPDTGPGTAVPHDDPATEAALALVGGPEDTIALFQAACRLRGLSAICAPDETHLPELTGTASPWALVPGHAVVSDPAHVHHLLDALIDRPTGT